MDRRTFLAATGLGVAGRTAAGSAAALRVPPVATEGLAIGRVVRTGAQQWADDGWQALAGYRVGVISNPTGVLTDVSHIVDSMVYSSAVNLTGVFGPEHGFRGSAQAGEAEETTVDPRTGVPVYDALGADEAGFMRMFTDTAGEVVVFDIQDVGARFYTYIGTMWSAMRAAARLGLRFIVLDRPNPVGGRATGPMLQPGYESGVGPRYIVQRHGMTVGELARLFNAEFLPDDAGAQVEDLEIVTIQGWDSSTTYAATGLPWVPPSPNMPTPDTAIVYGGTLPVRGHGGVRGARDDSPFEQAAVPNGHLVRRAGERRVHRPAVRFEPPAHHGRCRRLRRRDRRLLAGRARRVRPAAAAVPHLPEAPMSRLGGGEAGPRILVRNLPTPSPCDLEGSKG